MRGNRAGQDVLWVGLWGWGRSQDFYFSRLASGSPQVPVRVMRMRPVGRGLRTRSSCIAFEPLALATSSFALFTSHGRP